VGLLWIARDGAAPCCSRDHNAWDAVTTSRHGHNSVPGSLTGWRSTKSARVCTHEDILRGFPRVESSIPASTNHFSLPARRMPDKISRGVRSLHPFICRGGSDLKKATGSWAVRHCNQVTGVPKDRRGQKVLLHVNRSLKSHPRATLPGWTLCMTVSGRRIRFGGHHDVGDMTDSKGPDWDGALEQALRVLAAPRDGQG